MDRKKTNNYSNAKILINAIAPEECRIAKVIDNKLEEFHIESSLKKILHGNIYKGIITRVEPGLQAAFVDFGEQRHGFLQKHEIHSDYFQDTPSGKRSISNIIKPGQELLVQIAKDPRMNKGAMLTTFISLPGRYIVLMPGSKHKGISRKIEDETERNRLKSIINKVSVPEGFGIIVRTAGAKCNKLHITKDLNYLLRLWKNIKEEGIKEKAPHLVYKERNLVLRSIRDNFTPEVSEILIDNEQVYHEAKEFMKIISLKHTKIVKLHKGAKPIFTKHQLENQISSIYQSKVNLKSGGSVVIEQTEALVAIDVNSGKATSNKSIEKTALSTDLEAAEEIARQLRLRDLGGLIVIDFIDMKESKHKLEVEKTIKIQLKKDKAKTKVSKISKFGLMELSRQRINPSIELSSFEQCMHCHGKGMTPSIESLVLSFLRKLQLESLKENITSVKGTVPVKVADYILNKKKEELLAIEDSRSLAITIEWDVAMIPGQCTINSK